MTPQPSWDQLDRYLAGACTDAERDAVREMLAQSGLEADELAAMLRGADVASVEPERKQAVWGRLAQNIPVPSVARPPHTHSDIHPARRWARMTTWVVAAAAVVGIVVAPQFMPSSQQDESPRHYSTTTGQQATIELDDGSVIQLAPGSQLSVTTNNEGHALELDGEAFFTVVPNTTRSFEVRTASTTTRVLGTAFGVRHYTGDSLIRVAVASGKVSVNDAVLTMGETGEVAGAEAVRVRRDVAVSDVLSWASGRLSVRNLPMREAARVLQRWYGVEIQFADSSYAEIPLTSTMSTSASTDAVADILSAALGVDVSRSGTILTLY